jgi:hypothetical protein
MIAALDGVALFDVAAIPVACVSAGLSLSLGLQSFLVPIVP